MSDTDFELSDIEECTRVQPTGLGLYDIKHHKTTDKADPTSQRVSQDSIVMYESEFSPDRLIMTSPPKPPPTRKLDVEGRFYQHMRKVSDKVKRLGQELEESKLAACTFTPCVNSKKSSRRNSMYEFALDYEEKKQLKLEQHRTELRQAKEFVEKQCAFKPALCPKSVKLRAKSGCSEPVYEHLYKLAQSAKKLVNSPSFAPEINLKSAKLRRSRSISEGLYKDALRRRSSSREEKQPELEKSERSEQLLSARFSLEFMSAVEGECGYHPSEMQWEQALRLARKLELVQTDKDVTLFQKLWDRLHKESETVNSEKLYNYVSALLLLSCSSLPRAAAKGVHNEFMRLYRNRQDKLLHSAKNPTFKHDYSYSFKPKLSSKTIEKAKEVKRRRSLSQRNLKRPEDHLLHEGTVIAKKLERLKMKADEDLLKECTFTPKVQCPPRPPKSSDRNLEMFKEAKKQPQKLDSDMELRDFESAKAECVFQPNKDRKVKLYKQAQSPKGLTQAVDRMNRARTEQARVEAILKTGRVRKDGKENVKLQDCSMLKVTVRLNSVNYGAISVRRGADLEQLGREFAEKNSKN